MPIKANYEFHASDQELHEFPGEMNEELDESELRALDTLLQETKRRINEGLKSKEKYVDNKSDKQQ